MCFRICEAKTSEFRKKQKDNLILYKVINSDGTNIYWFLHARERRPRIRKTQYRTKTWTYARTNRLRSLLKLNNGWKEKRSSYHIATAGIYVFLNRAQAEIFVANYGKRKCIIVEVEAKKKDLLYVDVRGEEATFKKVKRIA